MVSKSLQKDYLMVVGWKLSNKKSLMNMQDWAKTSSDYVPYINSALEMQMKKSLLIWALSRTVNKKHYEIWQQIIQFLHFIGSLNHCYYVTIFMKVFSFDCITFFWHLNPHTCSANCVIKQKNSYQKTA